MWEYRMEHIQFGNLDTAEQRDRIKREMDVFGKDRWEAVSMVGAFLSGVEVLFKRHTQEYLDRQCTFGEYIADGLAFQDEYGT